MTKSMALAVALALCCAVAVTTATPNLVQELQAGGFTGFAHLLDLADVSKTIQEQAEQNGGVTIFAPTDSALVSVSPALLAFLAAPANRPLLRSVVLHHVVSPRVSAFTWEGKKSTLGGTSLSLRMNSMSFFVGSVPLQQYNALLLDESATVHAIKGVLVPAELEAVLGTVENEHSDDEYADTIRRSFKLDVSLEAVAPTPGPAPVPAPTPTPTPSPPTASPPPPKSAARKCCQTGVRFTSHEARILNELSACCVVPSCFLIPLWPACCSAQPAIVCHLV